MTAVATTPTLSSAQAEVLARSWIEAFNARDLEGLLALYHDDARHFSPKLKKARPETGGLVSGQKQLRDWWRDAFDRLPGLHYDLRSLTTDGVRIVIEYLRTVPGEDDLRVAEFFDVDGGKIRSSRVYHG